MRPSPLLVGLVLAVVSWSCGTDPESSSARPEAPTSAVESDPSAPADPEPEPVTEHIDHADVLGVAGAATDQAEGLEIEVVQADRLWDGAVSLSWRVVNVSEEDRNAFGLFGSGSARRVALSADARRSPPLREEESTWQVTASGAQLSSPLAPGEQAGYQAVFGDLGVDTVTFEAPHFEPVAGIPVTDRSQATDVAGVTIEELGVDDVRLELRPLERVGDLVALRATLHNDSASRYNGSGARAAVAYSWRSTSRALGTLGSVSLLDGTERRRHLPVVDPDGRCWCDSAYTTSAGSTREITLLFGAPAADHVAVYLPEFGIVPALPIVDVDAWHELEINGEVVPDRIDVGADPRPRLIAAVEELDGGTVTRTVRSGGDTIDVALAADVLFDVDDDQLRPDAQPLIDELVAQLEALDQVDGPVVIAGHTDSTGPRQHNQQLSERRAASVRTALEARLQRADLAFEVVGHGQDRPAVEEETDEDRQRNRRVEISLPG
jgi:outer membrane protein OmpA-like peptidoglycan-associated protein